MPRDIALVLDLSPSMNFPVGMTGRTRHDILTQAVANVAPRHPDARWFGFSGDVQEIYEPQNGLPVMIGGTNLTGALKHLRTLAPSVQQLVVISDGEPDDGPSALTEALMLRAKISTIYCGDETNKAAVRFLRDLTACSRSGMVGTALVTSLAAPEEAAKQIEQVLKLAGPSAG
jgi:hypothetical protein